MTSNAALQPIFFGPADSRLYGVLHRGGAQPAGQAAGAALVICQPTGEECADTLRGLRLLATRVAEQGMPVLRFDWFATGDSAGDGSEASWQRWVADVGFAIDEVRARTGRETVVLLGVRVGAALAALAAAERGGVEAIALWEPVEDGRIFVDEKRSAHLELVDIEARERPESTRYTRPGELLGFAFPPALEEGLRSLELSKLRGRIARRALVVRNLPMRGEGAFFETLGRRCDSADRVVIPEAAVWDASAGFDAAPVPAGSIAALVTWVTGGTA